MLSIEKMKGSIQAVPFAIAPSLLSPSFPSFYLYTTDQDENVLRYATVDVFLAVMKYIDHPASLAGPIRSNDEKVVQETHNAAKVPMAEEFASAFRNFQPTHLSQKRLLSH